MKARKGLLLLATAISNSHAASDNARPRGVGPEFAKHYKSPDTFACILNPHLTIPFARVNDDYCDCPDGSDEPGTAACSHLSPLSPQYPLDLPPDAPALPAGTTVNTSQVLPGFYCKNKGHRPAYVPFHLVNDGVCDSAECCDGSDEWARVGGLKCMDRCKEVGKEWRKQDAARQKAMTSARRKRGELVREAARLRAEVETKIAAVGREIVESEGQVAQLAARLAEAEKQERLRVVRGGGTKGPGGKLGTLLSVAKERVGELRKGLIEVRRQRDDRAARLAELEALLTTFKTDYNPNFNDEGVKRAVRAWEAYDAREKGPADDADFEKDLEEIVKEDGPSDNVNWAEWEGQEDGAGDVEILYSFEAYLPPSLRTWISEKVSRVHAWLIHSGVIANPARDGEPSESPALTAARTALSEAETRLRTLKSDRDNHQFDLARGYGPDDVFRALRGACAARDAGEYVYEFCWLDRTKQRPRKGGGDTNMGNWVGVETRAVDEALPADGQGVGTGLRWALKYENGQGCWNGPARSTLVVLACAEADVLWRVVEEEKCVYRMEVGTPAVCGADPGASEAAESGEGGPAGNAAAVKDEL